MKTDSELHCRPGKVNSNGTAIKLVTTGPVFIVVIYCVKPKDITLSMSLCEEKRQKKKTCMQITSKVNGVLGQERCSKHVT